MRNKERKISARNIAQTCALVVAPVAVGALVGWFADSRTLTSFGSALIAMAPNPVLSFSASGLVLLLTKSQNQGRPTVAITFMSVPRSALLRFAQMSAPALTIGLFKLSHNAPHLHRLPSRIGECQRKEEKCRRGGT